jgi:uncharacterized membrane protein
LPEENVRTRKVTALSSSRLEAFSDGVFAIAITLLILEIKVPNPAQGPIPRPLEQSLLMNWPAYLGYIVSFIMIGIYWVNHHYLLRLFRGTSHMLNLLNLHLLMWICVIPFPTAILSEYMEVPGAQRLAVMLYIGSLFAPAVAWMIYRRPHNFHPPHAQLPASIQTSSVPGSCRL